MVKKNIKGILSRYLMKGFCNDYSSFQDSYAVKKLPSGYFQSFGEANPDKIFYVIWLDRLGSGFFSNVSAVLCHLKIADTLGMVPVVDFQNYKTLYNVDEPINSSLNAWEYYFQPVSKYRLDEVYNSKHVFFCNGLYPNFFSYDITTIAGLYEQIFLKYVCLKEYVEKKILEYTEDFKCRILGVHFRGKEMNMVPGHPFTPTKKQIIKWMDKIIYQYEIDRIFLVTEEKQYLDSFRSRYGKRVFWTDGYRSRKINAYNLNPRSNHRYLLGLEVLVDAILLSRCTGILCGDSNVSEFARFVNHHKFEFLYKIMNGINCSNPYLARHLYTIKQFLPSSFRGLMNKVDIVLFPTRSCSVHALNTLSKFNENIFNGG